MTPRQWYALDSDEVSQVLRSDRDAGLTEREAKDRLAQQGPNELPEAPLGSPLALFLGQFSNLIVWVLVGAAILSGLLREWLDSGAILAIVVLNAILGFVQEYKAERSLAALKRLSVATARIVRDGAVRIVPARELVDGDLVLVEAGDHVPADLRLVYTANLRTQEAALTGESTPVDKTIETLSGGEAGIADRRNTLFLGTTVIAGKGRALVVATGLQTELGCIASMMQAARSDATPLQRRLEQLGRVLLYAALAIVSVLFLLGLLRGEPPVGMFLTAVSLAVAAIPEGLPAIVTIALALGVTRMAKRHALIRRLPAVETLGSTTVICTDKTGTLTKNEMTVTRLYVHGHTYEVTGEGYRPTGAILEAGRPIQGTGPAGLRQLLGASVLCNDARLYEQDGSWRILGDPTEGALLVAAAKLTIHKVECEQDQPLLGEIPFDPERKLMTVVRRRAREPVAYVKGAPGLVIARCTRIMTAAGETVPLTAALRDEVLGASAAFAGGALRVLGVAQRTLDGPRETWRSDDVERDLIFLGFAAMQDPLRPEAGAAVRTCHEAGITVVMITGDHKETASAIAGALGLPDSRHVLTGAELDRMDDEELARRAEMVSVYARVSAEHKLRIVQALKGTGAIVAMTGDGVNDAPALQAAHVGVAMGLTGTDVAKEAADMVVTDDNFASIEAAVEEGRRIFDNIRKAVHYLLSCNTSEVLVMFLTALFGLPLPLLPAQILWINLVTDGLPALALVADPAAPDLMKRPPRRPDARFFAKPRLTLMTIQGTVMALITVAAFAVCLYGFGDSLDRARTVAFTVLVMAQLSHAFNCRSNRYSLFTLGWRTNPHLLGAVAGSMLLQVAILMSPSAQALFRLAPFEPRHWLLVWGFGVAPLAAMEAWKRLRGDRAR
ncbi:MAG: cation-translocating P-type ATPase [Nitrospiraceae bacterium]